LRVEKRVSAAAFAKQRGDFLDDLPSFDVQDESRRYELVGLGL
jgi:hypothetical protein